VVVLGPGTIGILCAAMARLRRRPGGASVGLEQRRRRASPVAKQYGCEVIVGDATPWAACARRPRLPTA
jgi:alcohol dehydrogenase/L-iditol 2-dehydrogenase